MHSRNNKQITNTYWVAFGSLTLPKLIPRSSLAEIPVAAPALVITIMTAVINPAIGILCDIKDNIKIVLF